MKLEPYPEYKDSGVKGVDIPCFWDVYKLKSLVSKIGSGITPKGGSTVYVDEGVPLLRSQNVHFDGLRLDDVVYINEKMNMSMLGSAVKNHDVLLNITGASIGRCTYVENHFEKANVNQHVCIIRPKTIFYPFLNYFLMSAMGQDQIFSVQMGTSREGLNFEQIGNFKVIYPPIKEQKLIAEYLDKKTSEIDLTIEKDTQLIELLKEKRTALINHVVTKGLDPAVKMKDSGVEWIGEIPEDWELRKISQSFNIIGSGTTPKSQDESYYHNGTIPWVITGDLNDSILHFTSKKITKKAFRDYSTLKMYKKNSLLIAMYGATIGKISLLDLEACVNQACCVLENSKILNSKFVFYWFLGNKNSIISLSYGGGQPNISQDVIKNLKIQVPPIEEQEKIVSYLDQETSQIDLTIQKIHQKIGLLEEYKKSLIHHVVTGKVDVREVAV